MKDHIEHLKRVFQTLRVNKLLDRLFKCSFGQNSMGFLRHVIAVVGVHPDPELLGLTGYYGRFIKGYAQISAPMTNLLKKESFRWNKQATISFERLKAVMVTSPVLGFPDLKKNHS